MRGGVGGIEMRLMRAQIACALGQYPQALKRLAEADTALNLGGNREYLAWSRILRATIERGMTEFEQTESTARSAAQLAAEIGDRRSEISALGILGDVAG